MRCLGLVSFGNILSEKISGLLKALDNRFYVKFMQLEIGLLGDYACHSVNNNIQMGLVISLYSNSNHLIS